MDIIIGLVFGGECLFVMKYSFTDYYLLINIDVIGRSRIIFLAIKKKLFVHSVYYSDFMIIRSLFIENLNSSINKKSMGIYNRLNEYVPADESVLATIENNPLFGKRIIYIATE